MNPQMELGCDQYLSSYKHFFVQKLSSKIISKKRTLRYFSEGGWGPTATAKSLKLTWNNGPDQTV